MTKYTEIQAQVAKGDAQSGAPGVEHRRLEALIGKWINEGETVASAEAPAMPIVTSDVYEWVPGGFFVVHSAYGRIGQIGVGGTEIIGYDADSGTYRCHFFDSQGNATTQELTESDGVWTWLGETTRCIATLDDAGRTLTAHHERTDDGVTWVPSMEVTLTKVS
jgi:hypothetical protein